MKILNDNVITKADLTAVDEKQTRQIKQLRLALIVSFFANAALTIALKFL